MTDKTLGQQVSELRDYLDARKLESVNGIPARRVKANRVSIIWQRLDDVGGYILDDVMGYYQAESLDETREIFTAINRLSNLMHKISWAEISASGDQMGPLDQYR